VNTEEKLLFNELRDIIKNIFIESPENQILRKEMEKEREFQVVNQKKLITAKICPICGGKLFENGYIHVSGGGAVAISGISSYHEKYNIRSEDLVQICSSCGFVLLFANFETQHRIEK
jgi:hypothetical protein